MTVTENYMLQQMQQMAASMTALPQTGSKDKSESSSFQDLMDKTQKDVQKPASKDENGKPVEDKKGGEETAETAPVQNQEKEELRPEDMTANPNAVILDLFRPEIAPAAEEAAIPAPVEALPQETVEETAMNLDGQMPTLDTSVETTVEMETPTGEEQGDFRQAMQEPAETAEVQSQSTEQTVQQPEAADPEQSAERPESQDGEVRAETAETGRKDGEEIQGEAAEPEQSVFRETQSTPVKVGERYETVDTQKPDMEAKLADTIRQAVQTGTERVEIRLTPANLGAVTIEMTKDASGALQVVLHAANSRAAGLLQQHLDGLHTALQSYGAGQEVHVEVQRNQDSQQQHFQQADPDGRGQQQRQRQQEERQDNPSDGQDFIQKLRLGLFGTEETI